MGSPEISVYNATSTSITIAWNTVRPEWQLAPIISYRLKYTEYCLKHTVEVTRNDPVRSLHIPALLAGRKYAFEIQAANKKGYGPWSPQVVITTGEEGELNNCKNGEVKIMAVFILPCWKNLKELAFTEISSLNTLNVNNLNVAPFKQF